MKIRDTLCDVALVLFSLGGVSSVFPLPSNVVFLATGLAIPLGTVIHWMIHVYLFPPGSLRGEPPPR